ncbi:hypothetical protein quinque_012061 [Culex quinquefasciatus]
MIRTMGRWDKGVQKGEVEDRWENPAIATYVKFCGSEEEVPVDAIPEESRPTIWRSGRKQEEPALICGHPGKCRCFPDLSPSNLPPPSLISVPLYPQNPSVFVRFAYRPAQNASVRRKPPDTRGIPRAVPSTAEHDRSRTRIARDTVPVLASRYTNRRRKPGRPVDSSAEVPESVNTLGNVEAGGAEEGRVREQQLTAHSGRTTREEDVSRPG